MKIENQTMIMGVLSGFGLGVVCMFFVQTDKELNNISQKYEVENVIRENINTCEDIMEWMSQDVEKYSDSTVFDSYIWNLENMSDENRKLFYKLNTNKDR
tara:strand:- start:273 stop:572 length:300 start_codon:yes stop_codon:yes gene_type:complete